MVANLVIAALLATMALVATKYSHRSLSYALWLLVLLKLVTPPLYRVPLPLATSQQEQRVAQLPGGVREVGSSIQPDGRRAFGQALSRPEKIYTSESLSQGGKTVDKVPDLEIGRFEWQKVAVFFWGVGAVLYFCLTLYRLVRFRHLVRRLSIESPELSREAATVCGPTRRTVLPTVMVVDAPIAPLLWPGIVHPAIYLPKRLLQRLSAAERRDLLAHEMAHFQRRDPWRRWFETVVLTLYWWWPIAWLARTELERVEDECCDSLVLARPNASKKRYATLLLKTVDFLSEHGLASPRTACGFGRSSSDAGHLDRRIRSILKDKGVLPLGWVQRLAIGFIVGVAFPISGISWYNVALEVNDAVEQTEGEVNLVESSPLFAWDEHSAVQRIPKPILHELGLNVVTVDSANTLNFVLTKRFIAVAHVTPEEVDAVNAAIARTVHEYRMLERANLKPTNQPPPRLPRSSHREGAVKDSYSFQLIPFREDAAVLRERLSDQLRVLIGPTRGPMVLDQVAGRGELRMMRPAQRRRPDTRPQSYLYVYHYENADPPYVRFSRFSGSGGGGLPLGPALDRYAPVELEPVLRGWRKDIAEVVGEEGVVFGSIRTDSSWDLPTVSWPLEAVSTWKEEAPVLDLDKRVLIHLQVPARGLDGFAPTAAALLGLTEEQGRAIMDVYHRMTGRFLEIQFLHFRDVDPENGRYEILAFPEEVTELGRLWREEVQALVGELRMRIIDRYVRIPMDYTPRVMKGQADPKEIFRLMRRTSEEVRWWKWGERDIEIEVEEFIDEQGRQRFAVEYQIDGGGKGSSSGSHFETLPIRVRDPLIRRIKEGEPPPPILTGPI